MLRGQPSAFSLELPPYRTPQVGQVLLRSLLDRTAFVLGRAVAVAAPAGLLIWAAANVTVGGASVLSRLAGFLDPLGQFLGMDGFILLAFLLGFPANEIVVPCILMGYLAAGSLTGYGSLGNSTASSTPTAGPPPPRSLRPALYPLPLPLRHHLPDHLAGDPEPEVDRPGRRPPHRRGDGAMRGGEPAVSNPVTQPAALRRFTGGRLKTLQADTQFPAVKRTSGDRSCRVL